MEHSPEAQAGQKILSNEPHAIYMRKHRPPYSKLSELEKKKDSCRSHTATLIKRGQATMGAECEWCESTEELERHHPDYSDPTRFETVCKPCHRFFHRTLSKT